MPRNREDHSNPMNGRNGSGNKKPGMNMKKVFAISFCIVLGIVFISGGVIYKLGHDLYSSVNYVADDDVKTVETLPDAAIEETLSTEERTGRSVDKDELSNIRWSFIRQQDIIAVRSSMRFCIIAVILYPESMVYCVPESYIALIRIRPDL